MATQSSCQLIAEPEGEGVSFAVLIVLGRIEERKMQIIHFTVGHTVARIQNPESQTIVGGFVPADFEGNFSNLRGGYRVVDQ